MPNRPSPYLRTQDHSRGDLAEWMSQYEVARHLGVSRPAVERGESSGVRAIWRQQVGRTAYLYRRRAGGARI